MLSLKQKEKLIDYISGFGQLKNNANVPIGAIVMKEKNRKDVIRELKKEKFPIVEIGDKHPDYSLKEMVSFLKKGKPFVFHIVVKKIPAKIFNQLSNISHNVVSVELAWDKKPIVINPILSGGKVMLVVSDTFYRDFISQDIITSVCRC